MKKNIKYFILILIAVIGLNIQTVYAANAKSGVARFRGYDCSIEYENFEGACHKMYDIVTEYQGQEYETFCADFKIPLPNLDRVKDLNYTCEEIDDPTIGNILGSNASNSVKTGALRDYIHPEYNITGSSKQEIENLVQAASGAGFNGLTFTKTGGSRDTVIVSVTSPIYIEDVNFTCGADCTLVNSKWEGTSGTVTVKANGGCTYSIIAKYSGVSVNPSGTPGTYTPGSNPGGTNIGGNYGLNNGGSSGKVVWCHAPELQNLYFYADISIPGSSGGNAGSTTGGSSSSINGNSGVSTNGTGNVATNPDGTVTQTFTGQIDANTGGDYYKEYCDGQKPEEDKCDQTTQVKRTDAGYCDDANGESIKITAPDDIKNCIIDNKDEAGNSYLMDDGQVFDNKYCAVYCKENYTMTLPGARYSDSGRYFKLENTVVEAERTCYAAGAGNTEGIDLDQFVTDVINAQKELVAAYNAYKKALREQELAKDAQGSDTKDPCASYTGNTGTATYYEIQPAKYKGYNISCNDSLTGECTITEARKDTDYQHWGDTYDGEWCETGFDAYNRETFDNHYKNYGTHDFAGAVSTALTTLTEKQTALNDILKDIKQCYSWVNNLCMTTQVTFDYNEQYSSSINYTLVSGGGTFVGTDASYRNIKELDDKYTTNTNGPLETVKYVACGDECDYSNVAENISTLKNHLYYRMIKVTGEAQYNNDQEFATNYPHGTIETVADQSSIRHNYSYLGAVFPVALNTPTGVYEWTLNFSGLGQYNSGTCQNGRLDQVVGAIQADVEYVCVYVVDCDDCDYECVGDGCHYCTDGDCPPKCPECDVYCENCIFDGDESTYFYRTISVNDFNPNNRTLGSNWTNSKGTRTQEDIEQDGENIYQEAEYTYRLDPNNMKKIRDYNKETGSYVTKELDYHSEGGIANVRGTSRFLDEGRKDGFFTEIKRNKDWTLWEGGISDNVGPSWK